MSIPPLTTHLPPDNHVVGQRRDHLCDEPDGFTNDLSRVLASGNYIIILGVGGFVGSINTTALHTIFLQGAFPHITLTYLQAIM